MDESDIISNRGSYVIDGNHARGQQERQDDNQGDTFMDIEGHSSGEITHDDSLTFASRCKGNC